VAITPDEKVRWYTRAIELAPGYAAAYYNRGTAWYRREQFDRAIGDYTRAIEFKPDFVMAYRNRAGLYYFTKEYDKAWADVHECGKLGGVVDPRFLQSLQEASGREE